MQLDILAFGAHPDDWQLFMNPNAYHDAQNASNKVVFIYLTAGDAGAGLGNGGRSQPYYLARENGAKLSVRFIADAAKAPEIPIDSVASSDGVIIGVARRRSPPWDREVSVGLSRRRLADRLGRIARLAHAKLTLAPSDCEIRKRGQARRARATYE